jgi:PKD repeat protein
MKRLVGGPLSIVAIVLFSIGAVGPEFLLGGPIFINEVAWAGARWEPTAEWIELFNPSSEPVDLEGWRLVSSDGSPDIDLHGTILPKISGDPTTGFFLLERDSDDSVPEIAADLIYRGALTDRGEALYLLDSGGNLADTANASAAEPFPWPAGTDALGVPPYASMERLDHRLVDARENWANSTAKPLGGPADRPIQGTPRAENSTFNVPPTPSFEHRPRDPVPEAPIEFDGSKSFDENDSIVSYRWDFGDGTDGSGPTASHTYELSGEYRVVLVLTDESGSQSELSRIIRVQVTSPPVADFSVILPPSDRVPRAGGAVRFQDESSDIAGEIAAREWQFGDGTTASDAHVVHTYDSAGVYLVSLWVLDDQGEEALQTQSVTIASRVPVAVFTRSPERPNANDSVRFDASGSCDPDGHIAVYRWDFDGNGTYERETFDPIVELAFPSGGTYDVRLAVVDDAGDRSSPFVETLLVNQPPIAEFQLSAFESEELTPICFTDMSYDEDGAITGWLWSFGDGTTAAEANPEHAFEDDGTFAVSLTVTDENAAQHTTTAEVVISNLPPIARLVAEMTTQPTGEPFQLDASGSTDPSPRGSITRYEWDLDGDGTFDDQTSCATYSHVYDHDGRYEILVRVTDDGGAVALSDPISVTVTNRVPRIDRIAWTPETPTDTVEVRFSATAIDPDGEIAEWYWDLGDGAIVMGSNPATILPDDGRYTILLTVQDDDGARSDPFRVEVIVENAPPIAEFAAATVAGRCVIFDARDSNDPSPTGRILHIAWDFGDGTSCPGTPNGCGGADRWTPGHCYSEPGAYVVALVVIDEQGALARNLKTILIAD